MKKGDIIKHSGDRVKLIKRLKIPHYSITKDTWVEYWSVMFIDDKIPSISECGLLVNR